MSGSVVNEVGVYTLIVTDSLNNSTTINFTVVDTSLPIVMGIDDNGVYNSRDGSKYIYFDKGTATLNGNVFMSGSSICATGSYKLIVTANNSASLNFIYIKYGDVTGDGIINLGDLTALKKHLLKISILGDPYKSAGKIKGLAEITVSDLLEVKKSILGMISLV